MKKLLVIVLLMAGVTAIAQQRKDRPEKRDAYRDFSPEQMATLHSKRLALLLDLSEAQRARVMELQMDLASERAARRKARETDKTGTPQSAEERFDRLNSRLDRQLVYKAAMKDILSGDQYAKWERMRSQREHRSHRAGKHRSHFGKR